MGGESKSSTIQDSSTNVSTVTETTLGDIGISGQEVNELAAILSEGISMNTRAVGDIVTTQARNFVEGNQGIPPTVDRQKKGVNVPLVIGVAIAAFAFIQMVK